MNIDTRFSELEKLGLVRIRIEPDYICDLEYLLGDGFKPEVCPEIDPEELEKQKQAEIRQINNEGVWGIVGEYLKPECTHCKRKASWEHVDSIWGFIGDSWKNSGYDADIKAATIAAFEKNK